MRPGGLALRAGGPLAVIAATALCLAPTASARPGDLDPSFAGQGKFTGGSLTEAVAVQPDGKVVLLHDSTISRLRANGTPDKPFGDGKDDGQGKNFLPTGYSGASGGADLALQPDGKILVTGFEDFSGGTASFVVARLTADGALDTSFGTGGRATIPLEGAGGTDFAPRPTLALANDGRVVVVGNLGDTPQVARFTATGQPDPTLGGDGLVAVQLGLEDQAADVAVGGDGTIFVAGTGSADLAVARLDPAGVPDPTFSGEGVQHVDFGPGDSAAGVGVQPDGKVVVAGTSSYNCRGDRCDLQFALARLDTAGELDPGFGTAGKTTTRAPSGIAANAASFALLPDGRSLIAGGGNNFFLARYLPDGTADGSFGDDGRTWTHFLGTYPAYGTELAPTADGGAVVTGFVYLEKFYDDLTIARYEGGDGPADIDADGFGDAKDDCPRTFGEHKSGCPLIVRKLKLKLDRKKDVVEVRVGVKQKSGEDLAGYRAQTAQICSGTGKVSLVEERRGSDRVVDRDGPKGGYEFKARGRGSFYAKVGKATPTAFEPDGPVELCAADSSKPLRLGG
jgi:uncharacterized delta-60 repeat protein